MSSSSPEAGRDGGRLERLTRGRFLLLLTAFFVASRMLYHAAGLGYDAETLGIFWQFLDPELLREDLVRSLFYLHSQPPLFNLFLGLVLKVAPSPEAAFHGIYGVTGGSIFLGTVWLARRLGASRAAAVAPAAIWVTTPSFALTEHWLMYDLPVAATLLAAAVFLERAVRGGRRIYLHVFFLALLAVCGMRSLFHPLYLWGVLGAALVVTTASRRIPFDAKTVAGAAAVPLLVVSAWQLKNGLIFGTSGTSSWLGMNLARIAGSALSGEDLQELYPELELLGSVTPFSPLGAYPPELRTDPGFPPSPALDALEKSTGAVNYNHGAYIRLSRVYLEDSLTVMRERPGAYLHGTAKAWYNYLRPQSEIPHVAAVRERLGPFVDAFEDVVYGQLPFGVPYGGGERKIDLFALLGIPGLWLFAVHAARRSDDPARAATLFFMCGTVLYVALVGNTLEVWENQRFRFATDPFTAVFAALLLEKILAWKASRGRRRE